MCRRGGRDPRGPSLSRDLLLGPEKEISPGQGGGKRVSTSIFREPGVLSRPKIFSSLIFRNVTRLLPRRAFSIFLEIQRIAQSREDFSSKRFLHWKGELLRNRERMLATINIYIYIRIALRRIRIKARRTAVTDRLLRHSGTEAFLPKTDPLSSGERCSA